MLLHSGPFIQHSSMSNMFRNFFNNKDKLHHCATMQISIHVCYPDKKGKFRSLITSTFRQNGESQRITITLLISHVDLNIVDFTYRE
jgi:hypothetical protein